MYPKSHIYDFSKWKELPSILVIVPTFGRITTLEESIECFLRQDYPGESKLLVINDFSVVKLSLEHPKVEIVNLDKRFSSLGAKLNWSIKKFASEYDYFLNVGDDDLYLPWMFSVIIENLKNVRNKDCPCQLYGTFYLIRSYPGGMKVGRNGKITGTVIAKHDQIIKFRDISVEEDRYFWEDLPYHSTLHIDLEDLFFIIREGFSSMPQLSKCKDYEMVEKRAQEKHREGKVILKPRWVKDYIAMCANALPMNVLHPKGHYDLLA